MRLAVYAMPARPFRARGKGGVSVARARTGRLAASTADGVSDYRGMRALVALLVAMLALFCIVIVDQAPLAEALRSLRRSPLTPGRSAIMQLGITVLAPLCGAVLAYGLSAL